MVLPEAPDAHPLWEYPEYERREPGLKCIADGEAWRWIGLIN